MLKGTISSRSEQTFDRTWNRCPSFKMNLVTENNTPRARTGPDNMLTTIITVAAKYHFIS